MFPVEEKIGEISAALAKNRDVVLTAPPGSGKTTCVPPALLDEPWLKGKKIVMLEPRRLAARNCATYIAKKRGEAVGETVVLPLPGGAVSTTSRFLASAAAISPVFSSTGNILSYGNHKERKDTQRKRFA